MFVEEWRDIKDYEGLYQVSNLGRIQSFYFDRKLLLKLRFNGHYYQVTLYKNGKPKQYNVHRLVAETFISNPKNLPYVNHKNEDKTDNSIENLEWCTHEYNIDYGTCQERRIATQRKPVICVETGKRYVSMVDAGKQLGISYKHMSDCCKGKRKTTGGYHWKYAIN